MRKIIYVIATLIAVMTLSMVAFAADTWTQANDGKWYCADKDGNLYYGTVKKSGESFYYLDDATGEMVTNKLVDIEGYQYWFGADGAKVIDKWVQVPVEDSEDGWEWMYFKPMTGKAVNVGEGSENFKQTTINGKKYVFDNRGHMLYGYLTEDFGRADNVAAAEFNYGAKSDGSAQTGWVKVTDGTAGPAYEDASLVYFHFKNGAKTKDGKKKVNGVYYYFNTDGSLVTGYKNLTTATEFAATGSYYLGEGTDGTLKKNQWVKTSAFAGGETAYWYYLGSDGKAFNSNGDATVMKKINGKIYLFDKTGKMLTGLKVLYIDDYQGLNNPTEEVYEVTDETFATVDAFKGYVLPEKHYIYYFSTDADNDGSMKTGDQIILIDGEEVIVRFSSKGVALEGNVKGYIYNNGILQKGVGVVKCNKEDKYYLVNANGKVLTKAVVKDADGQLWAVSETFGIAKFADQDYAGRAASAWKDGKETFTIGSKTYKFDKTLKTGYWYVKYTEDKPE